MIRQQLIDLVKHFEGCKLTSYKDIVGVYTIGYGHTGPEVTAGLTWTQDKCNQVLLDDLAHFQQGVMDLVTHPINPNQLDALTDFAFNLGLGALQKSTLLELVNKGLYRQAADEFAKWSHAGGRVIIQLLKRRNAERDLFLE